MALTNLTIDLGDDDDEIDRQLARLGPGLTAELIEGAVERGVAQAVANTPALGPATFGGAAVQAQVLHCLSMDLIAHGWQRIDKQNFCTIVSPDGCTRIAVASGDHLTGCGPLEGMPKTKNPRGSMTTDAISRNETPTLREAGKESVGGDMTLARSVTYFLLVYREEGEVRSELSRPRRQEASGRVSTWAPRLVMEPVKPEQLDMFEDDSHGDDNDDFDVPRRSA